MPGLGGVPELKLMPEFEPKLPLEFEPRLAEVAITVPAPGVPRSAVGRISQRRHDRQNQQRHQQFDQGETRFAVAQFQQPFAHGFVEVGGVGAGEGVIVVPGGAGAPGTTAPPVLV